MDPIITALEIDCEIDGPTLIREGVDKKNLNRMPLLSLWNMFAVLFNGNDIPCLRQINAQLDKSFTDHIYRRDDNYSVEYDIKMILFAEKVLLLEITFVRKAPRLKVRALLKLKWTTAGPFLEKKVLETCTNSLKLSNRLLNENDLHQIFLMLPNLRKLTMHYCLFDFSKSFDMSTISKKKKLRILAMGKSTATSPSVYKYFDKIGVNVVDLETVNGDHYVLENKKYATFIEDACSLRVNSFLVKLSEMKMQFSVFKQNKNTGRYQNKSLQHVLQEQLNLKELGIVIHSTKLWCSLRCCKNLEFLKKLIYHSYCLNIQPKSIIRKMKYLESLTISYNGAENYIDLEFGDFRLLYLKEINIANKNKLSFESINNLCYSFPNVTAVNMHLLVEHTTKFETMLYRLKYLEEMNIAQKYINNTLPKSRFYYFRQIYKTKMFNLTVAGTVPTGNDISPVKHKRDPNERRCVLDFYIEHIVMPDYFGIAHVMDHLHLVTEIVDNITMKIIAENIANCKVVEFNKIGKVVDASYEHIFCNIMCKEELVEDKRTGRKLMWYYRNNKYHGIGLPAMLSN